MGDENMKCVEVCGKDGKKKRFCPKPDGKGLDVQEMGNC